jgi:predicted small lipoprotein YifL
MKRPCALILIMTLVLVSGCGRKTPPVPPQAVIAAAVTDLRCQLDDRAITLTWTYPRLSVNNVRIDSIRNFVVYKARIPAADYCQGCPVLYDHEFEVDARKLKPGNQVTFHDKMLEVGYHYVYMVQASSGWRILSKDSNRIDFVHRQALLPPADLQVGISDSSLSLSWSPVRHRTDGTPVTGLQYQVYRSLDNKSFSPKGLPVGGLSVTDPSVTNSHTYFYQVRAVQAEQGIMALSRASKTAIGMPLDMTPPAPPSQLSIVGLLEGVQLHWQGSPDADVGGYYIYRQGSEGAWQRIATAGTGAITYTDFTDQAAGVFSYRVTAFDRGVRRNESTPSQTVSYTKP